MRLRSSIIIYLAVYSLFLAACSSLPGESSQVAGLMIEGVTIRNELSFSVTEVQLLVPASGNFVGCGHILARSQCSTTFPERNYQENAVVITWKERGQPNSSGEFIIKISEEIDLSRTVRLEVVIFTMGQAGAKLVQ